MEFSISRSTFAKALDVAAAVSEKRSPLPILANVLLKCQPGKLLMAASDLSSTVVTELECTSKREGGITLPASSLADIVGSMRGEDVTVKVDGHTATITSGKSKFTLGGISPADFPRLPASEGQTFQPFDKAALVHLFGQTAYACSADPNRFHLHGVYLECDGDTARAIAGDGSRLSVCEVAQKGLFAGVLIPKQCVGDMVRAVGGLDALELCVTPAVVMVRGGSTLVAVKALEANFPRDISLQMAGGDVARSAVCAREALVDTLKRAALAAPAGDLANRVTLTFSKKALAVTAKSTAGTSEDEMDVDYQGKPWTLAINVRLLIEAVEHVAGDEVTLVSAGGDMDPLRVVGAGVTGVIALMTRAES